MNLHALVLVTLLGAGRVLAQDVDVLLLAGEMVPVDKTGHHDYRGGIRVLDDCLRQTPGVRVTRSDAGWPADERELAQAEVVVFYCDGGGKQPYLASPERLAAIEALVARGAGLVLIHQAVDHPAAEVERALRWMGGSYDPASSTRGHWRCSPDGFPTHELTAGVGTWTDNDGWLATMRFVSDRRALVPCVWASRSGPSTSVAGDAAIVAWGYERPTGGRSFAFTGLDGHATWKLPGVRRLVTNGVLWAGGIAIPPGGAPCELSDGDIDRHLTPRPDGRLFKR